MFSAVMIIALWPYSHQPPCTIRFKGDARRPDTGLSTVRRVELIDVPEGWLFQRRWQWLLFDNAATDLTSTLGRILNAHRFFLSSTYPRNEQNDENNEF